jgi:hypothetical protein
VEFDDAALVLSNLACQSLLACRALLCGLIFGNDFLRFSQTPLSSTGHFEGSKIPSNKQ